MSEVVDHNKVITNVSNDNDNEATDQSIDMQFGSKFLFFHLYFLSLRYLLIGR